MNDAPVQQQCAHPTQATCVRQWEADHQRTVLQQYGLADEFHGGCDAIEEVVTSLIEARQERDELRSQIDRRRQAAVVTKRVMIVMLESLQRIAAVYPLAAAGAIDGVLQLLKKQPAPDGSIDIVTPAAGTEPDHE